jgi:signal recognition particle subunit SRP19
VPDPTKPLPEVAVPRGWKLPRIIPLHSPAMSGGGISENIFKDMMGELQAGGMGQLGQMGLEGESSSVPKKKDKKKAK